MTFKPSEIHTRLTNKLMEVYPDMSKTFAHCMAVDWLEKPEEKLIEILDLLK